MGGLCEARMPEFRASPNRCRRLKILAAGGLWMLGECGEVQHWPRSRRAQEIAGNGDRIALDGGKTVFG